MIKKISALFLALVLCLSVMVVPGSALESGKKVGYRIELDADSYTKGSTVTVSLYMEFADSLEWTAGSVIFGMSDVFVESQGATTTSYMIEDIKGTVTHNDAYSSIYKTTDATWAWVTQAAVQTACKNSTEATYEKFLKLTVARSTAGSHENATNTKKGITSDELNADTAPYVSFQLTLAEDLTDGTEFVVGIPSGSLQGSYSYMASLKSPGTATTTNKYKLADCDITAALAESIIGVEPCETHTWDNGVEKTAPTCGEAGEMLYTCTVCKSTKTETIEATGNHTAGDPVDENVVAPSCDTAGSKEVVVKCSVCEFEMSRTTETIPATGDHNYATKKVIAEATCTEAGSYVMVCGCGEEDTPVTVDALGHDFSEVDAEAVAPTCTTPGSEVLMGCSRCDATEGGAEVDALGHNMVAGDVVAPTCTTDGYTVYTCANNCGTTENRDEVDATGHDYEAVVTAPTCTEDGYTTYTCPACGDTYTADEVPATGHSHEASVTKEPTCTRTGTMKYTCACGDSYTEEIPALNHTNPDGTSALETIPAVEPTCTVQGYTEGKLCTICNAQAVVPQGVPATGHTKDPNNAVVTAPTYTSQGYTTYTCFCGDTFVDDYVPALTVEFTFEIAAPSVTTLRAKDTIILHPVFTGEVAEGVTVEWTADNENFKVVEVYEDGSVKVQAKKVVKGTDGVTTFTATAVDAEGNEISSDTVELTANAKFFQQFLGFFRAIFGLAKHYEA